MPRLGALALVLVGVVCAFAAAQGAHAVAASSRKHLRRTLNDSDLASAAPAPPFHRSPAPAPSLVDVEASQSQYLYSANPTAAPSSASPSPSQTAAPKPSGGVPQALVGALAVVGALAALILCSVWSVISRITHCPGKQGVYPTPNSDDFVHAPAGEARELSGTTAGALAGTSPPLASRDHLAHIVV